LEKSFILGHLGQKKCPKCPGAYQSPVLDYRPCCPAIPGGKLFTNRRTHNEKSQGALHTGHREGIHRNGNASGIARQIHDDDLENGA